MANKYLDNDGVLYLWNKIKSLVSGAVPTKTSDLTNDSGFITAADVPEGASASTATPLMDGTAAVGTSTAFARGDHRHPSDNTKVGVDTFATAMANAQTLLDAKVDKVTGKGLSTNDYTTAEKEKLAGIEAGAEVNVFKTISLNGTMLTPTEQRHINIGVPVASDTEPLMDGTAAIGTSKKFARGDHVHPSDTSKVDATSGFYLANVKTPTTSTVLTALQNLGLSDNDVMSVVKTNNQNDNISNTFLNITGLSTVMTGINTMLSGKADASTTYTKTEVDNAIGSAVTNMYKYKGSVATVSALPSSGNTAGDVYDVQENGMNYAWTGTAWDALGEIFTITAITNGELDTICT